MMNYDKKTKAELIAMLESAEAARNEAAAMTEKLLADLKAKTDALAEANRQLAEAFDRAAKASEATQDVAEKVIADRIVALRAIIDLSCQDHCPHHQSTDACRNCVIRKRLDALEV